MTSSSILVAGIILVRADMDGRRAIPLSWQNRFIVHGICCKMGRYYTISDFGDFPGAQSCFP
jgi:hypothetical protein